MSDSRWQRVRALHAEALDLPAAERRGFLEKFCEGDSVLLEDVWSLIVSDQEDDFLETPAVEQVGTGVQLGDFLLLEELGSGGAGIVFRARQKSLERDVAIKVMPRHFALNEKRVARFVREAKATAKLKHPGIAPVYEVGQVGDNHFFAMELVVGHDLAHEQMLRAEGCASHIPKGQSEAYRYIARVAMEVADALSFAHENGVVHRDVKPNNILLDKDGRPRLADFGIALDESLGDVSVESRVIGTPYYMSPEQARAVSDGVDARTDVYSLGVVLYELLAQAKPFDGNTSHEVLHKIIKREAKPLREVSASIPMDLAVICAKAMEKSLLDRYPSASALRDDLNRFLDGIPITAMPPGMAKRCLRFVVRNRVGATAAACLGLAMLGNVWARNIAERDGLGLISLEVDGGSPAHVIAIPLNPFSGVSIGSPIDLGMTPVFGQRLAPGRWRFVVERKGVGYAEIDRDIGVDAQGKADSLELSAHIVQSDEALAGLVHFESTDFTTRFAARYSNSKLNEMWRHLALEDFSLGTHEATFGEFRSYLKESGHPRPVDWEVYDVDPISDVMPVVGIRRSEAVAFAEWMGCRLAYVPELELAAGGLEHRDFPWGQDFIEGLANLQFDRLVETKLMSRGMAYDKYALPSISSPEGRTPEGIYHMLGNVSEYTASLSSLNVERRPTNGSLLHVSWGGHWVSDLPHLAKLPAYSYFPIAVQQSEMFRGVRIAKGSLLQVN